jgi:type II secretion system protein J
MPATSKKNGFRGFSLVEVLLAMAILALVLSMVYTILVSTLNAYDWVRAATEVDRMGNRIAFLLARDIQAAYTYQIDGAALIGEKSQRSWNLHLVSNTDSLSSSREFHSDICEVGYSLESNPDEPGTHYLVRREDFFLDDHLDKGGTSIRLYDRVLSFELKFYDDKGVSKSSWNSKEQKALPASVEVAFEIPEARRGSSPVALRQSARTFKVYVPLMVSAAPKVGTAPDEKDKEKKE